MRATALFLIAGGEAVVEVSPSNRVVLKDGDFFGEMALLDEPERTATLRTLTACSFMTLGRAKFDSLMQRAPDLRATMDIVVESRRGGPRSRR